MKRSTLFSIFIILVILFSAGIGYCFFEAYRPDTPTEQKIDDNNEYNNNNTSNKNSTIDDKKNETNTDDKKRMMIILSLLKSIKKNIITIF